jgi:DNA-binding LacI/PurR family transcriptional regulator
MRQYTIKDIAIQLNLSPSTVSRALHKHPDISEETRQKVLDVAKELEYQPNPFARGLKKNQSKIIGVIVPQVKHFFFAAIMSGITDVAYKSGFAVMICQSNEREEREIINIQTLISQRISGMLVSLSQMTNSTDHFQLVIRLNIPVVFFDRVPEKEIASTVVVDDYEGALNAVEYLIKRGYRRIAHLAGPQTLSIGHSRFNGYVDALARHNIPFDEELVVYGGLNEEDGVIGFQALKNHFKKLPDAIFTVNDPVAIGVFTQLKEHHYRIPEDVAILGFSDNPIASLIEPPLTTVRQPAYEIGRSAATLLIRQIENEEQDAKPEKIVLKTELIIRKST